MADTPRTWLLGLLESVGLDAPDGRPLYAYRCSTERFEEARRVLTGWRPGSDGARAFAVYAAEWWRRNYAGGPWRWEPLLDSIQCETPYPELYEPLRRAWRLWGVKPVILGGSIRYLGTCACQGGLPLRLVSSRHTGVHRFLRALLREYHVFRRVVDDGYTLAEPLCSHLPRTLRHKPVYVLCADLMDQIWNLRTVGSQDDPVASLDQQQPDWRSRMPIDLDDQQARELIVSLLRDAAAPGGSAAEEFEVLRYITDTATGRRFVVEPRVPPYMNAAALARRVDVEDLPPRFQLRIEGSRPLPVANGRVAGEDVVFSRVLIEPDDLAALADQEIRWFVQAGRPVGESFVPRGGAAPAEDLPWVFASLDDDKSRLDLYAEGSVRTRFPRVAVACSEDMARTLRRHPDCGRSETQPIAGRVMFDVEGDVKLDTPVGTCRIRTAQNSEQQFEHRLTGDRCFDVDASLPLYHGAPSLTSVEPDGAPHPVPAAEISWRAARGDRWVPDPVNAGVWRVRREVDGEIVFLSKVCVVGQEFRATVRPGPDETHGFIHIDGIGGAPGAPFDVASKHPQVDVQADRIAERLRVTVRFIADGNTGTETGLTTPPSHVQLATRWPNGSTLPLRVPFPGRGARFAHPERADRDALWVESLYGWRALAISPKIGDTFRLHGELLADDLNAQMEAAARFDIQLRESRHGVFELPLIDARDKIESLFAATKLLDAQVRLELRSGKHGHSNIVVRRFACDVDVSKSGLHSVPAQFVQESGPVAFEAFSLESPGDGRTPLEPIEEDGGATGWRLPESALRGQTRIVLARSGNQHFARPIVDSSGRALADTPEVGALPEAASIPDTGTRIAAMKRILKEMADGRGSENPEYLADLLDVSSGLPATTFDALDCLSDSPRALVRLLLRTPEEQARGRIWRLEDELPFTWLLVPVKIWRQEMNRAHQAARTELIEAGFTMGEVRKMARARLMSVAAETERFCPGLNLLARLAAKEIAGGWVVPTTSVTPPPHGAFDPLFLAGSPYQDLLLAGDRFRWPRGPDRTAWAAEITVLAKSSWKDAVWKNCRGVRWRRPLTDAPFGAAFAAALSIRVSPRLVHATKLLRSHAPEWFDVAYRHALARILKFGTPGGLKFGTGVDAPTHD